MLAKTCTWKGSQWLATPIRSISLGLSWHQKSFGVVPSIFHRSVTSKCLGKWYFTLTCLLKNSLKNSSHSEFCQMQLVYIIILYIYIYATSTFLLWLIVGWGNKKKTKSQDSREFEAATRDAIAWAAKTLGDWNTGWSVITLSEFHRSSTWISLRRSGISLLN